MTEDEAKTKWCPAARDSETAGNRSAANPGDIRFACIASACMAWRWSVETRSEQETQYVQAIKNYRAEHDGASLLEAKIAVDRALVARSPTVGYCGLAGPVQ